MKAKSSTPTRGRSWNLPLRRRTRYPLRLGAAGVVGHRSPYLSHAKRALYHLSYDPKEMTEPGLEPRTSALLAQRSNQLSYHRQWFLTEVGFEPTPRRTGA